MSALAAVLDVGGVEVARILAAVEERMTQVAGSHGALLARYAGETISAGGKRLRPLLLCLAAGVPPPESEDLVRAAAAVELVHAASLVHDDVLDAAALRRGRPTVVASGGRALATATGDLLFSRAFALLAGCERAPVQAVRILSRASSQLAVGELLQRADAFELGVSVERYLERCRLKTAVLFRAASELGAVLGGGDGERLGRFAELIGLAFQILDDVLDVIGSPEETGKPRGTDLLDGTVTLPLILARETEPRLEQVQLRSLGGAADVEAVWELIAGSGAPARTREQALALVSQAKAQLPQLPARQRAALELVADGVVERYS
jgi:geranylgeranyl pyrophosphate synthase